MSFIHDASWTLAEKIDLLVNVLQSAYPDLPSILLQIIHDQQVYPKWNDIPLPKGRSLHSSQIAFEEMSRLYRQQGRPPPPQIHMPYPPHATIAPAIPQQRPLVENDPFLIHRALQPRPPRSTDSPAPTLTNGETSILHRPLLPEPTQEPRRKRGRPSKEEAEERDRALAAEGRVYQPKKRARKPRISTETLGPEAVVTELSHSILQTPITQVMEPKDEGSSGKRRSKRQQLDDAAVASDHSRQDFGASAEMQSERSQSVAQSPSDRLLASHRERDFHPPPQLLTPSIQQNTPRLQPAERYQTSHEMIHSASDFDQGQVGYMTRH